jgi:hemerythrin
MSIEWSEDLSTGIADIDEQHKELFLRFNALEDACRQQRGLDEIGRYMDYLMEYTAYHFAAEEREMSRYNYTGLQRHHQEHEQFKREINALYNEIRVTGARMTLVQTTRWASMEWLVAHVKNTDGEMAAYLKKQG